MNYRHAYHAGNFADVLKHAVLALVIDYLKRKEAPLRVIDTHAGAGRYALASEKAQKTGEWLGGIGRLLGKGAEPLPQDVGERLRPYLDVVRRANPQGRLQVYPGSPLIALALMRPQDTLIANELQGRHRRRPQGQGDGARRLGGAESAAAAQGAARGRAHRSAVRGGGRARAHGQRPRTEPRALRHRRLHRLVSDQGSKADPPLSRGAGRIACTQAARRGAQDREHERSGAPQRLRARCRQSAIYARGRSRLDFAASEPAARSP